MSKEPFALSTVPSARPTPGDYDAICAAVMHSARGRWFLNEFARRNRNADTQLLLDAIERIEAVIRGDRSREALQNFRIDLLEMAKTIAETRAEVAGIKPEAAPQGKRVQPAGPAAPAPVSPDIFAAAERIQDVAWAMRERGLDPTMCEQIEALATSILSASSLRDPHDHRAQKLGGVLQYLEQRINTMLEGVASAQENAQALSGTIAAPEASSEGQLPSAGSNGHDAGMVQAALPPEATVLPPDNRSDLHDAFSPEAQADLSQTGIAIEAQPEPAIGLFAAAEWVPAPDDAAMEPHGGPASSVVTTPHEVSAEIELEPLLVASIGVPVADQPALELELAPILIDPRFEAAVAPPVSSAAHADDASHLANLSSARDLPPEAIAIAPLVPVQVETLEPEHETPAELELDPIKVDLPPAPAAVPIPATEEVADDTIATVETAPVSEELTASAMEAAAEVAVAELVEFPESVPALAAATPDPAIAPTPLADASFAPSDLEAARAIAVEPLSESAEAAPAVRSGEPAEPPNEPPELRAAFSAIEEVVIVDIESRAPTIDMRAADRPAEPIAAEHEPPMSLAEAVPARGRPESAAAAITESAPELADVMLEIERELFAADAEPTQEISRNASFAQPVLESSQLNRAVPAPPSQTAPPPAAASAEAMTAAAPAQNSSEPRLWRVAPPPAPPSPRPTDTPAAPAIPVATAAVATSLRPLTPARPVARPMPRPAPNDPLAALKAMSDEERIALFT